MTDEETGSVGKLLIEVLVEMAHMREAHAAEVVRAVAEERAAAVAWLRSAGFVMEFRKKKNLGRLMSDIAADAIERAEHLKGET